MMAQDATENSTRTASTAWLIGPVSLIRRTTSVVPAIGAAPSCTCSARTREPSVYNEASHASANAPLGQRRQGRVARDSWRVFPKLLSGRPCDLDPEDGVLPVCDCNG